MCHQLILLMEDGNPERYFPLLCFPPGRTGIPAGITCNPAAPRLSPDVKYDSVVAYVKRLTGEVAMMRRALNLPSAS